MPLVGKSGIGESSGRYSASGGCPLLQGCLVHIAPAAFGVVGALDAAVALYL